MSTSTVGALIASVTSDVTSTGGVAIVAFMGIAVGLLIFGFFWSRLKSRAVRAKGL